MDKYKVITDKSFFEEFSWLSNRVKMLGGFFQNQDSIAEKDEVEEWNTLCESAITKLIELQDEGLARIEKLEQQK